VTGDSTLPSSDQLVSAALEQTGLEDFGGESWREGLEVLLQSARSEAQPSATGSAALETQVLQFLINRLEISSWLDRHPEIDDQIVSAPLFSVGMVRSGTTALSFLLDEDPEIKSLLHWQAMYPCPPPTEHELHDDVRIARAAEQMGVTGMDSRDRSLIETLPDGPCECLYLLGMEFKSGHIEGMFNVPSYHDWLFEVDLRSAYEWHRRCLKLLQWRSPTNRWSLKFPSHTIALDAIVSAYPDAQFIMTHRDPVRSIASVCSLVGGASNFFTSLPDPEYLGRQWTAIVEAQLRRMIDFRDRNGDDRFIDIHHGDLVRTPMDCLERIYAQFEIPLSDEAAHGFASRIASNPSGVYGVHHYDPAAYGLDIRELNDRFAFYRERFEVELEPFT
jgi:hypothetical protein